MFRYRPGPELPPSSLPLVQRYRSLIKEVGIDEPRLTLRHQKNGIHAAANNAIRKRICSSTRTIVQPS